MPKRQRELLDPSDIPRNQLLTKAQQEMVDVDELNLNDEYASFAGKYADWTALYARAYKKAKTTKHNDEIEWAKSFLKIQEKKKYWVAEDPKNNKMPPLDTIKALTTLDDDRVRAHKKAILADAERERLKVFLSSIESKKEMLRSLGAKLRTEMEGDLAVRDYVKDQESKKS